MGRGGRLTILGVLFGVGRRARGLHGHGLLPLVASRPSTSPPVISRGPPSTSRCRPWARSASVPTRRGCRTSPRRPSGQWVHTTLWDVPAHTRINVTVYQYDGGSPLRNQQFGQVTGTIGDVAVFNGKPFNIIDSNSGNGVGHTFAIPTLGISVPLYADNGNANLCAVAPCTAKLAAQHREVLVRCPRARGSIRGSASSPVGWGTSTATVVPCPPWATWADSSRWWREPARGDAPLPPTDRHLGGLWPSCSTSSSTSPSDRTCPPAPCRRRPAASRPTSSSCS